MVELVAPEQVQVRSGGFWPNDAKVYYFGINGYYLSKRAHLKQENCYSLSFPPVNSANVYTVRWTAFPLRCLAD